MKVLLFPAKNSFKCLKNGTHVHKLFQFSQNFKQPFLENCKKVVPNFEKLKQCLKNRFKFVKNNETIFEQLRSVQFVDIFGFLFFAETKVTIVDLGSLVVYSSIIDVWMFGYFTNTVYIKRLYTL